MVLIFVLANQDLHQRVLFVYVKAFHLIIFVIDVLSDLIQNGNLVYVNVEKDILFMETNVYQTLIMVQMTLLTVVLELSLIVSRKNVFLAQMDAWAVKIRIHVIDVMWALHLIDKAIYVLKFVEMDEDMLINAMMETMMMVMVAQEVVELKVHLLVEEDRHLQKIAVLFIDLLVFPLPK